MNHFQVLRLFKTIPQNALAVPKVSIGMPKNLPKFYHSRLVQNTRFTLFSFKSHTKLLLSFPPNRPTFIKVTSLFEFLPQPLQMFPQSHKTHKENLA